MEHFSILKILQPIPHYIILGVPDSRVITQEVRQGLKNFGIKVDIIDLVIFKLFVVLGHLPV